MTMGSALYIGRIRHRRMVPIEHSFSYKLSMWWLDLDDYEDVLNSLWYAGCESLNWVSFRRKDYFCPEQADLKQAVIERVNLERKAQGLQRRVITRVCMLTHLRYFNIIFNPVTFYYCFDVKDEVVAILAEITNTPWGERHNYVLPVEERQDVHCSSEEQGLMHSACQHLRHQVFRFKKQFHVSPFNPMEMDYRWVFSKSFNSPNPTEASALRVHMDNTVKDTQINDSHITKHFDATLVMDRRSIQQYGLRTLIRFPLITVTVVTGIYWQALKLALKRAPFYSHPNSTGATSNKGEIHESNGDRC